MKSNKIFIKSKTQSNYEKVNVFFLSVEKYLQGNFIKPKIKIALFFTFTSILFFTCKRNDFVEDEKDVETKVELGQAVIFNVGDQQATIRSGENPDSLTKTTLGDFRQNPYTIENMAAAHRDLYGSNIQVMPTTDLYVKFMPTTLEEYDLLTDTDEFFYDYPLEYEVIEMGDYYQELGLEEFPVLYAVLKPDFDFPHVNYEIISSLYLI